MGRGDPGGPLSVAEARVGEWAARYRDAMQRIALDVMHDPDDAKDVVQRALVAAVTRMRRKPEAVEQVRNPGGWLARITRNAALDTLRKRARRQRIRRGNEAEIRERLFPEQEDFGWDYGPALRAGGGSRRERPERRTAPGRAGHAGGQDRRRDRPYREDGQRIREEAAERSGARAQGCLRGADRQPKLRGGGNGRGARPLAG